MRKSWLAAIGTLVGETALWINTDLNQDPEVFDGLDALADLLTEHAQSRTRLPQRHDFEGVPACADDPAPCAICELCRE